MTIQLPKELEAFVHDAVRAGRYTSEAAVISDALERLRQQTPLPTPGMGSIGAMRDAADELDQIVADAYRHRREEQWRDISVE
jgi:Arc/MetJ-type ribon-helix-helix transcriptional regulator